MRFQHGSTEYPGARGTAYFLSFSDTLTPSPRDESGTVRLRAPVTDVPPSAPSASASKVTPARNFGGIMFSVCVRFRICYQFARCVSQQIRTRVGIELSKPPYMGERINGRLQITPPVRSCAWLVRRASSMTARQITDEFVREAPSVWRWSS